MKTDGFMRSTGRRPEMFAFQRNDRLSRARYIIGAVATLCIGIAQAEVVTLTPPDIN